MTNQIRKLIQTIEDKLNGKVSISKIEELETYRGWKLTGEYDNEIIEIKVVEYKKEHRTDYIAHVHILYKPVDEYFELNYFRTIEDEGWI